ncbi:M23 family metallopeptidase [Rubrivirga sp. IMCC43871]|uniref:M23 family metallopeptidase n=1 Tax=Rubrivirga sp. IMCC43871 TaxID=3391575 RepID=UPI00398FFB86
MSRRLLLAALALIVTACADRPAPPAAVAPAEIADRRPRAREPEAGLSLVLPTANRALLSDAPERFYQGLNATVDSLRPEKWEGGQYGFVRDPVPTIFGMRTFRRVHEGIDIAPTGRDADGEPVDSVVAIDAGRVAYVNDSAGASSYGKYVVVEHDWSDSPVYSLYAHLADVAVAEGEPVARGGTLGKMGYTGRGLGRSRAHVHLEIALMLNEHEDLWFEEYYGTNDLHGLFFGTNLAGIPPAELFLALEEDPTLTFPEFVRSLDEGYVVDLPGGRPLDLLARYPWLGPEAAAADTAAVPGWRVTFSQEGVPIGVGVASAPVDRPTLEGVSLGIWLTDGSTNQMLLRKRFTYQPTPRGRKYFSLLATTADGAPRW